jgi:hypothetical protein
VCVCVCPSERTEEKHREISRDVLSSCQDLKPVSRERNSDTFLTEHHVMKAY